MATVLEDREQKTTYGTTARSLTNEPWYLWQQEFLRKRKQKPRLTLQQKLEKERHMAALLAAAGS